MTYKGVWTLSEQKNGKIHPVSYELLNRGKDLAEKLQVPLSAVVLGNGMEESELNELILRGADKVYCVDNPAFENFLAEPHKNTLCYLVEKHKPEIILAAATTTGRTVMPCVASELDTGLTADCTVLDIEEETGNLLQTRPAIGGNILATIKTPDARPQMSTVRPKSTKQAERDESRKGEIIYEKDIPENCLKSRIVFEEYVADESQSVPIEDADLVVAGGRGMGKVENFELIKELASILDGAVGASRDAVDKGWIEYPHQIGLSGKTISPKLYIAFGISGAIQHIAGMQTSETIVAINKDPDAQIFRVADLGIVGDALEIAPALISKLKDKLGK
jgi:electron transfer flavoprotein alpha subunit